MKDAKRELKSLELLDKKIDSAIEDIRRIEDKLLSLRSSLGQSERVSGGDPSDFTDGVAKVTDLQRQLKNDIDLWISERERIVTRIHSIEPEELGQVLYKRYVLNMPLYMVADRMGYSYIWCRIHHGEALAAYQEMFFPKS